jgi:hypothetical protein
MESGIWNKNHINELFKLNEISIQFDLISSPSVFIESKYFDIISSTIDILEKQSNRLFFSEKFFSETIESEQKTNLVILHVTCNLLKYILYPVMPNFSKILGFQENKIVFVFSDVFKFSFIIKDYLQIIENVIIELESLSNLE